MTKRWSARTERAHRRARADGGRGTGAFLEGEQIEMSFSATIIGFALLRDH